MTAPAPALPDLGRLPRSVLSLLIADIGRLPPLPTGPLPLLDGWMIVGGGQDLLYARGYLDGGAERLRLPLLTVAPERPAVWLVGAAWVELGAHAFLDQHAVEDGEELAALLVGAERWCDALHQELRHAR